MKRPAYIPPMGLHLGERAVRCLWLEWGRVRHAAAVALDPSTMKGQPGQWEVADEAKLTSAVESVLPPPPHPTRITLVVPDEATVFLTLSVDTWPRKVEHQRSLVLWHLRRHLSQPPEMLRIAWQVVATRKRARTVAIVAAWEPFVQKVEAILAQFHCEPGWTLPESLARDNWVWGMWIRRGGKPSGPWMLIHWEATSLTATLFENTYLIFKRRYPLFELPGTDRFLQELTRALETVFRFLHDFQPTQRPNRVYLTGPDVDALVARLQASAPFPIDSLSHWVDTPLLRQLTPPHAWQPLLGVVAGGMG